MAFVACIDKQLNEEFLSLDMQHRESFLFRCRCGVQYDKLYLRFQFH